MRFGKNARQEHRYGEIIVAQIVNSGMRRVRSAWRVFGLMQNPKLAGIVALASNKCAYLSNCRNRKPCCGANFALCRHDPLQLRNLRRSILEAKVFEPID